MPSVPDEFYFYELATRINGTMGTHYTAQQIESMNDEERMMHELWAAYGK